MINTIPDDVKQDVQEIVDQFNKEVIGETGKVYHVRFQDQYVYVDRDDGIGPEPICRLTYNGDLRDWAFAIYKYSGDAYDPEEAMFPGADLLDGTIEGALHAGMKAYG